jgi:hypothetical protein
MRFRRVILGMVLIASASTQVVHAEGSTPFPTEELQPMVVVSKTKVMERGEATRIVQGAAAVGASAYRVNFPFIPLTAQIRDGVDLFRLKSGWRIALATMVVEEGFIRAVGGVEMAAAMAPGFVLMGESAASVRKAKVGDVLMMRDQKFGPHMVTIGGIVADSFVDWGDILMSPTTASVFGEMKIANVSIVNIPSSKQVIAGLKSQRIVIGDTYRVRTSWDNVNPDKQLGTGVTKELMGEFAFRPTTGGSIVVSPSFLAKNIVWRHKYKDIPLVNNCHRKVIPAIQGALTEIKEAGLAKFIDVQNSNSAGGCFVGRYNRLAKMFGSPSRHAWGMALDINTNTNQQGTTPRLNCDVVRIFRKWGFAWGGGFYPADGMHFEYVGEPRDEIGFRSRYCSNDTPIPPTTLPSFIGDEIASSM